jgi:hypothetical protein
MRLFHLPHPDAVGELPAGFADWALAWDATEKEAKAEAEQEAADRSR